MWSWCTASAQHNRWLLSSYHFSSPTSGDSSLLPAIILWSEHYPSKDWALMKSTKAWFKTHKYINSLSYQWDDMHPHYVEPLRSFNSLFCYEPIKGALMRFCEQQKWGAGPDKTSSSSKVFRVDELERPACEMTAHSCCILQGQIIWCGEVYLDCFFLE